MKEVIMNASIMAAIILAFVGIVKLPFSKVKSKHPKLYRFMFYFLSLGLSIGLPFVTQIYLVKATIYSMDFIVLELATVAGVFGLYTTYEGTSLKNLVGLLISKIKELCGRYSDSKISKMVENVGLEKINEVAKLLDEKKKQEELLKAEKQNNDKK